MSATQNPFDEETVPATSNIDLTEFDGEYATTEVENFDRVPDGKYQVKIERIELAKTRERGTPMIKWRFSILSGPQTGRKIFKNSVITKDGMKFVKGDLEKVGLQLGKLSELGSRLPELLDKTLELSVVTKKDGDKEYINIYLNRLLSIPAGGTDANDIPW